MSPTEELMERFEQFGRDLDRIQTMAREIADGLDRAIRDSDRRAEAYLPILRRAGIVPSRDVPPRRRPWWW
jgi:hypothetical protein